MISAYSDPEISRIGELLKAHYSASQVASVMTKERGTNVTRNMIIGIVRRNPILRDIGFSASPKPRAKMAKGMATKAPVEKVRQPVAKVVRIVAEPVKAPEPAPMFISHAEYDATSRRVLLTELTRFECRWAVNDAAKGEDHKFCGHPSEFGQPWCTHHAKRAIGKGTESERRVDELLRKAAA